jgi:anti-sigma-K factor RskA
LQVPEAFMPSRDPDPELTHPEAAGWVLGVLDAADADRFAEHLPSCPDCQAAVAELGPVARLLQTAAPGAVPPPDLQARTLASVAQAAAAARRGDRHGRWRSWNVRMLTVAAAIVVIAVAVGTALALSRPSPAETYTVALRSGPGLAASGQAVVRQTGSGWSVQLTVSHLADLGPDRFYECWWAGPGNRPGHPVLVTAGSFTVGSSGTATVQMWTAANPDTFSTIQIAAETPASTGQGRVVLTGAVTGSD